MPNRIGVDLVLDQRRDHRARHVIVYQSLGWNEGLDRTSPFYRLCPKTADSIPRGEQEWTLECGRLAFGSWE